MFNNSTIKLYSHISKQRRLQFKFVLLLAIFSAFAEIVSLGAVVPFIAIITAPQNINSYPLMSEFSQILNLNSNQDMAGPISLVFVTAAIISGTLRVVLLKVNIGLSNATGADLSFEMFRRTLNQPYLDHINRSSSDIISGITQKVASATSVLSAIVAIITNLVLFAAIFTALLFIDPLIASLAFAAFGLVYLSISIFSKKILKINGQIIASQQTNVVKISQEGLSSIRDVIIDRRHDYYSKLYLNCVEQLRNAVGTNQFITLAPRYILETVALVLIGLFAFSVSNDTGLINSVMPTLGALALGAQRLLPILQQLYGNYSLIAGSHQSLVDVLMLLEQPELVPTEVLSIDTLEFHKEICLDHISFKYAQDNPVILSNLTIKIRKGETVGFVGETGSGKSTAIDIILGLLQPDKGRLLIDGVEVNSSNVSTWQSTLTHVPQHIYLTDATIAENIAFGIPTEDIDYERVFLAGDTAQMTSFVDELKDGYLTIVGERGIKFSGGQRQRIGIARALYKKSDVLVLDEATSALDEITQESVMKAVNSLDPELTLIIITHRIKTLRNCDKIFEFVPGGECVEKSYKSLIKN